MVAVVKNGGDAGGAEGVAAGGGGEAGGFGAALDHQQHVGAGGGVYIISDRAGRQPVHNRHRSTGLWGHSLLGV